MIDPYTYTTPNGRKPAILLEELELPYRIHRIDIGKGDQFSPDFVGMAILSSQFTSNVGTLAV